MKKLQNLLFFLSLLFGLIMVPIGAQAVTNEAGYYIYGDKYDGTTNPSSSTKLHYKLSPLNGSTTEYFIDLFADDKTMSGVNRYSTGNDMSDSEGVYANMNGTTFRLARVASNDATPTVYGHGYSGDYSFTNTDSGAGNNKTLNSNGNWWKIQNNGGMYRFIITVNSSGVPTNWRYVSYPNQLVIYKLSAASNWTIDGFFYCTRSASGDHSGNYHGYNQQFFGTSTFTKDGEFLFILGDKWLKRNKNNESNKYTKNTSWDDNGGAKNLTFEYATGVYGVMYNPTQDEYQLRGPGNSSDKIEIWIAGNAVSSAETTSNFSDWSTNNSIQLTYSDAEACWKGTLVFTKNKDMRFLHNNDKTKYFGEDANAPTSATEAVGGDTQLNNKVAYKNLNNNIHFLIPTGRYIVRFYMKAAEGKNFTDEAVYWYTLELIEEFTDPAVDLSPASQTVRDDQTITTTLSAENTTYFAYTVGTTAGTPTLDSKQTVTSNFFGTLSYDATNDRIAYTDNSSTSYVSGRTIAITVQAITADGTALVDDTEVTRIYTFTEPLPNISPNGGFFINKVEVTLQGDLPISWTVKDASDNVLRTGTITTATDGANKFMLSTPGYLTYTDANSDTYTSSNAFDFTYSTSENYESYYSNHEVSQTVYTGGGQGALNVFINVDETLPNDVYIYAYNKTLNDEWLALQGVSTRDELSTDELKKKLDETVQLTSTWPGDNLKDAGRISIDGMQYVHFTVPESNLRKAGERNYNNTADLTEDDKVAIIICLYDGSDKNLAMNTQSQVDGYTFSASSDPAFFYVAKNTATSNSPDKTVNTLAEMPVDGSRTIFFTKPSDWGTTIYCHAYNDNFNLTWKSAREKMTFVSGDVYKFTVPATLDKLIFTDGSNQTNSAGISYTGGRKMFDSDGNSSDASTTGYPADLTEYNTFLNTPPTMEVKTTYYPNGEDYWKAAPGDLSIKLDPKWGTGSALGEENITNWDGSTTVKPKRITSKLTQTIQGLDAGKTYTVQAIVRGDAAKGNKVTLTLNGAEDKSVECNLRNGSGGNEVPSGESAYNLSLQGTEISTNGRVEYLEPVTYASAQNVGAGWNKVEATVYPTKAGWLTISIEGSGDYFDLSNVTLLEDANTDHGFRTTASTSATDVSLYDYRDRTWKKNNAYSFFDRGKNRNALIYADKHSVIAMDNTLLSDAAAYKSVDRKHPFNVVATNGGADNNGVCEALYLTDMGYGTDADNPVDYTQPSSTSDAAYANYGKSGYSFKAGVPFSTNNVVLDRPFGKEAKRQTTIMLPFSLTQAELKNFFGNDVQIWKFNVHDKDNNVLTFTPDDDDLDANVPYIMLGANGTIDSRVSGKELSADKSIVATDASLLYAQGSTTNGQYTGAYKYQLIKSDEHQTYYVYGASSGKFATTSANGTHMKPFRCYFTISAAAAGAPSLSVLFDNTLTGITTTETVDLSEAKVYNVNGMLVNEHGSLNNLPKGVYIVNGKKFVVK